MESPYGININSEMGDDSKNSGNLLIRENIASDDIDNTYLQYILEIPLQLNDELEDNEGLKEFQSLFYWKCFCNGLSAHTVPLRLWGFNPCFIGNASATATKK